MKTICLISVSTSGFRRSASAIFVMGPMAKMVSSPGWRSISAIRNAAASSLRGFRLVSGAPVADLTVPGSWVYAPVYSRSPHRRSDSLAMAALFTSGLSAPVNTGTCDRFSSSRMWNTYSAPCAAQTLPGVTVMPWMAAWAGLRSSITSAAPSSPNSPESVSKITISRAYAPGASASRSPATKRSMNSQYSARSILPAVRDTMLTLCKKYAGVFWVSRGSRLSR